MGALEFLDEFGDPHMVSIHYGEARKFTMLIGEGLGDDDETAEVESALRHLSIAPALTEELGEEVPIDEIIVSPEDLHDAYFELLKTRPTDLWPIIRYLDDIGSGEDFDEWTNQELGLGILACEEALEAERHFFATRTAQPTTVLH